MESLPLPGSAAMAAHSSILPMCSQCLVEPVLDGQRREERRIVAPATQDYVSTHFQRLYVGLFPHLCDDMHRLVYILFGQLFRREEGFHLSCPEFFPD